MKPWIKRSLIGALGVSLLAGGLSACAGHRMGGPGGWAMSEADSAQMRERFIERASKELALDDAQKAKLGAVADAMKAQRAALVGGGADPRAQMRADLQSLVAGSQFDRAKAQSLLDAKTAAVRDKAPTVIAAMADFYDSLKPEQQQKVRDFMARGGHRHGWRG